MTDPLIALFDPLIAPLTRKVGLDAACAGIVRLLNAAALDAMCGHRAHGDRLVEAIGGQDAAPSLRRLLSSMVTGRRQMWPEDRRILRHWAIEDVAGGVSLKTECEDLDDERAADLIVQMLVDVPPASVSELRARLEGACRPTMRDALADRIAGSDLRDELLDIMCAAFDVVDGPGRQLRSLTEVAIDPTLPLSRREAAWRVIVSCPESELEAVIDLVDLDTQQELTALGTAAMLRRLVSHPEGSRGLAAHLGHLDPLTRRELTMGLEAIRQRERIPAPALYGPILEQRAFPDLDPILVPALVKAGGPGAEHALTRALAAEADPACAQRLRRGLLDLRTARINPGPEPDHVRAWVGICDGHGAFPVLLATQNERLRYRMATVVVRCDGELRDGSVIHDLDLIGLDEVVKGYDRISEVTEVSPAIAAAFVAEGLDQAPFTQLPRALQQAADEVLAHARHDVGPPDIQDAPPPTIRELRSLYLRPTLHTWFLDAAALEACSIPVPPFDATRAIGWSRDHAGRLTNVRVRERAAGMALHLARWSELSGNAAHARIAAGALDDLEQGGTVFARALLEQTAFTALDAAVPGDLPLRFGNESLREELRASLAPNPPRGQDLGTLDIIDLLVTSGRDLCGCHVDAASLRPDQRRSALIAAGIALGASFGAGVDADLLQQLHALLHEHGVPANAVEPLASAILRTTTRFLHDVCKDCPVQCWSHPDTPVGRRWVGPGHPGVSASP